MKYLSGPSPTPTPTQNLLRLLLLLLLILKKCFDDSLVHIWKLKFGHKIKFLPTLWAPRMSRFLSWSSGEILKLNFSHYFTAHPCMRLWRLFLVEIAKLGLVKIFKLKFSRNADVWMRFWSYCLIEIMKVNDQNLFEHFWYNLKNLLW